MTIPTEPDRRYDERFEFCPDCGKPKGEGHRHDPDCVRLLSENWYKSPGAALIESHEEQPMSDGQFLGRREQYCLGKPEQKGLPTESELSQAYQQGYQDGRRAAGHDLRAAMQGLRIYADQQEKEAAIEAVIAEQESDGIAEKMVRMIIAQTHKGTPMTTARMTLTDADRAEIAEIGKAAAERAANADDNLAPWRAELDAMMPRGEQWVIYQTSNGLRSVVAKVNAALIAPEHGTAKEIAEGIVRDHNNALAKVAQPQPATKGE